MFVFLTRLHWKYTQWDTRVRWALYYFSIHADYVFSLSGLTLARSIPCFWITNRTPGGASLSTMVCTIANYGPDFGCWVIPPLWDNHERSLSNISGCVLQHRKCKTIPLLACECPDGTACTRTYLHLLQGTACWPLVLNCAGSHRVYELKDENDEPLIVHWEYLPADRLHCDRQ